MNPFEMVVAIVAIGAIASVLRARYGVLKTKGGKEVFVNRIDPDTHRLREEVKSLKDRIAVLERLATDTNRAVDLDREIEKLRS